jgi:hypothetical protein
MVELRNYKSIYTRNAEPCSQQPCSIEEIGNSNFYYRVHKRISRQAPKNAKFAKPRLPNDCELLLACLLLHNDTPVCCT